MHESQFYNKYISCGYYNQILKHEINHFSIRNSQPVSGFFYQKKKETVSKPNRTSKCERKWYAMQDESFFYIYHANFRLENDLYIWKWARMIIYAKFENFQFEMNHLIAVDMTY